MKSTFPIKIARSIRAADGYLDLKMPADAEAELQAVPVGFRCELMYLVVVSRLCFDTESWERAAQVGALICRQQAGEVGAWVNHAYAVRRHSGLRDAELILREALALFPTEAIVPYNLACYASQRADFDDALRLLNAACEMDATYKAMGEGDEDLDPLRAHLADEGRVA